ncbi:coenzyme F420-0:L-glutamate ligase [Nocardioides solisilvae]|uniref:coenzyme F420-0:L-glutamate ligase n=1 Tax=Nocardioides solisilvae TaxID=1542435 RepID=UPI000D74CB76|nr:coenzyme F420-0:L-glutamate ligase [Nocardioides solisilvae]
MAATGHLTVHAPDGLPEVAPGDDLGGLVVAALRGEDGVREGDTVLVTSKVVAKAEGRVADVAEHAAALAAETARVVARRGATTIVRTRLGLVMAAAGIDRSNVPGGSIVLLPADPDASAARLRRRVHRDLGVNVAVVVTDTSGRAWREGQTDIAVGIAGLVPLESHVGLVDAHGHELAVTAPAVADELAGAAELAQGKLGGRPVAVVRGRPDLVLPVGEDGPGARALVRPAAGDLFGLGTREAVLAALLRDPEDRALFGAPVPAEELGRLLALVLPGSALDDAPLDRPDASGARRATVPAGASRTALEALCFSHGWRVEEWVPAAEGASARVCPAVP